MSSPQHQLMSRKKVFPHIHLYDAKGIPRLVLSLGSKGVPYASFFTADSVQTAILATKEEDESGAGIMLFSGNGKYYMEISVTDEGVFERSFSQTEEAE